MRKILLGSLILSGFLYANSTEIFPDVLSSESVINFYSTVEIKDSGEDLVTPKMDNKNKAKCEGSLFKDKFCEASGESPKALKEFNFLNSSVSESIEIDSDITLNAENIGNMVITKDNLTITFDAPNVNGLFSRTQKIASIIDEAKNTSFIFKAGDYYIGEFEVISQSSKKKVVHDRIEIKTDGNSRFFIKDKFEITKNTNSNPKDAVIVINKDKSSKELMIYSLGDININTTASFNINALVYSFANFDIVGNPQSSFSGAIHSKGELNIGNKKSIGEFIYDSDVISEIYSDGFKLYSLPTDPKEKGKKTLEGIDNNRNGVRDDVEIFVTEKFPDSSALQIAYFDEARLFQEAIVTEYNELTKKENQLKARKIGDRLRITATCRKTILFKKFGRKDEIYSKSYKILEEMEDKVANTFERIKKYAKFNALHSGGTFTSPSADPEKIDELCPSYVAETVKEEEENEK